MKLVSGVSSVGNEASRSPTIMFVVKHPGSSFQSCKGEVMVRGP